MSRLRVASALLRFVAAVLCVAPWVASAQVAATSAVNADTFKQVLKALEENIVPQLEEVMTVRTAEIQALLELPAERVAALQGARREAIAAGLAAWSRRAEKAYQDGGASANPSVVLANASIVDAADMPDLQPAWQEGLRRLLTPEESKRLSDRRGERKARVMRSLTELFLLFLDERLALSAGQRERLLPIAEKVVPRVEELVPAEFELEEEIVNPAILLSAGRHAPEKEVRAILADAQWVRWQNACTPPVNLPSAWSIPGLVEPPRLGTPVSKSSPAAVSREPVDLTVSKYMAAEAARQRQRLLDPLLLQVEEATRVSDLPAAVGARLQTAARGAAEKSLQQWAPRFQQFVRNNVQEATPENVSEQLARLANPAAFQTPNAHPPKHGIFERSIKAELTASQLAAWQKEIDARRAFRTRAIIGSVLTGFDRMVPLRPEQFAKLTSILTVLLAEYHEELETTSPWPDTAPWFLHGEARYATLAGIDPKEMEALLGQVRWQRWSKTEEYTHARTSWNYLKENHQNRRR